jgi:hypothetical protein
MKMGNIFKHHIVDHSIDLRAVKQLIRTSVKIPPPEDKEFKCHRVDFLIRQHFNMGGQYRLMESVHEWIATFNHSRNYNGCILCPEYHRFADDHCSPDIFAGYMRDLFRIIYMGVYEVHEDGHSYHIWVKLS